LYRLFFIQNIFLAILNPLQTDDDTSLLFAIIIFLKLCAFSWVYVNNRNHTTAIVKTSFAKLRCTKSRCFKIAIIKIAISPIYYTNFPA